MDAIRDRVNAIKYRMLYSGNPEKVPWEKNTPLPALVELIEEGRVTIGRALDVGCGLGTQSIYLARQGFTVDGIDFQNKALDRARERAAAADVTCNFEWADVTEVASRGPYDLILDRGCFHSLGPAARARYAENLRRWLGSGGYFLLAAFVWETRLERFRPVLTPKIPARTVHDLFASSFELVDEKTIMAPQLVRPKMIRYLFRMSA